MKFLIALLILSSNLFSADIPLNNLQRKDLELITGELSANFNHTAVASSRRLGKLFGFQVGVVGGITESSEIDRVAKATQSTFKGLAKLPTLGLAARATVPFGLGGELTYIPKFEIKGIKMGSLGLGVSLDLSSALKIPIVSFGVKGTFTKMNLGFDTVDPNSGANVGADFDSEVLGFMGFLSKKFLIVEPYVGFGTIKADGSLSAATSLFQFTNDTKASVTRSSSHFVAGVNLNLLAFKFGAEYSKLLGTSKIIGKLSFGI